MRLGIIGGGVVGHATARAFLEHAEVRVYDRVAERSTHSLADALDCDLIMLALPTPQKENSLACDYSAVEDFLAAQRGSRKNYVIRSTVPVGTTRLLGEKYDLPNLCHSPEFLTARCAVVDAQLPSRNVVGGPLSRTSSRLSDGERALLELYERRFPGVPVHLTTSDESEAIKLIQNSLFAVTVAFWNEARCLVDALAAQAEARGGGGGVDWGRVQAGILADGRVSKSHHKVPGPSGGRGFSGTCLPKDLASLISTIEAQGLSAAVTRAAYERNLLDRRRA
jgi:UDPglucose 6-dehydrogenase